MSEQRMAIAVDFDSTLWDVLGAIARHPEGARVTPDACATWDSLRDLCAGEDEEARLRTMRALLDRCYTYDAMAREGLFPGALDAARAWKRAGAEVHVMTNRPRRAGEDTERFLRDVGYPYDSFAHGRSLDKAMTCRARGIPVLVDDHPEVIERALGLGLTALTLRYRYNAAVVERHDLGEHASWETLGPAALAAAALRTSVSEELL